VKSYEASVRHTGVQRKETKPITDFTLVFVTPARIRAGFLMFQRYITHTQVLSEHL